LMDGLCVVDMGGAIQEFNETYRQMLGWSADELRKMTYPQLTPETWHVAEARIVAEQILPRGYSEVYEKEYRRKDGSVFPVELRTFLLREGGKPSAMWAIVRDVTARKKAERALQESESRFRRLAEAAPVGIFHAGGNGEATFVNAAVLAFTGLSAGEATPPASWEIIHPEDREWVSRAWTEAVAAGTDFTGEFRLKPRGGRVTWVRVVVTVTRDDSGAKAGFVGALVDITESREVQAQLAMNSRLASMGTLVQGVAHEVNNPLAAEISGQGLALEVIEDVRDRLAASDLPDKEELGRNLALAIEALEDAQLGGKRIARIVQDLATLASPDPRRTRVRLIDIVDDARRWLLPSGARAAIVTVEDRGAPDVLASPGQIEQVLVNLLTNAANATQEGRRGEIAIRVGPGEPGMARLEVVDQGTGIAPANLTRIFDPFFTTHPAGAGRGSGLGLAIGHNIVRAHGGRLTVTSEVGKGSTFRVELPVAPGES